MRVRVKCVVFPPKSSFLFLFFFERRRDEIIMKSFPRRESCVLIICILFLSFLSFSSSSYFYQFLSIFIIPFSSSHLTFNRITFSFYLE